MAIPIYRECDLIFRIDEWRKDGSYSILQTHAFLRDREVAQAAFGAVCRQLPAESLTLRIGAAVVAEHNPLPPLDTNAPPRRQA